MTELEIQSKYQLWISTLIDQVFIDSLSFKQL